MADYTIKEDKRLTLCFMVYEGEECMAGFRSKKDAEEWISFLDYEDAPPERTEDEAKDI